MPIKSLPAWRAGACAFLCLLGLAACNRDEDGTGVGQVRVAVPVSPIAGLVRALVPGDGLDVVVLVPVGSNPTTYAPSIGDQRRAAEASLYLEIGHPAFVFEQTWLDGILDGSPAERVPVFDGCPLLDEDPHVWVSAECLQSAADVTAAALGRLLPDSKDAIEDNLEEFRQRLATVSESAASRLQPYDGWTFIVLHAAWGYLARDHGLTQVEILSHGSGDPGAGRLAQLIRTGREAGVSTVFIQPQFNTVPADIIASELGAATAVLDPLQEDPIEILEEAVTALETAFKKRETGDR